MPFAVFEGPPDPDFFNRTVTDPLWATLYLAKGRAHNHVQFFSPRATQFFPKADTVKLKIN